MKGGKRIGRYLVVIIDKNNNCCNRSVENRNRLRGDRRDKRPEKIGEKPSTLKRTSSVSRPAESCEKNRRGIVNLAVGGQEVEKIIQRERSTFEGQTTEKRVRSLQ